MLWGRGWGLGEGGWKISLGIIGPRGPDSHVGMGGCGSILSTEKTDEGPGGASCRVGTSDCHPNWVKHDTEKEQDQSWERQR